MKYYEYFSIKLTKGSPNKCKVKRCCRFREENDTHFCFVHRMKWREYLRNVKYLDVNVLEGLLEDFISR